MPLTPSKPPGPTRHVTRMPPLARLARWVVVLGIIVAFSAFAYPLVVRGSVDSQQEIVDALSGRLEFLERIVDDAVTPADSVAIAGEIASTRAALDRTQRRLERRQQEYADIWRWNGRGPMLIAVGLVFLGIGIRLNRFVQYGE